MRRHGFAVLLLLALAPGAGAVPSPLNSTIPSRVLLVGRVGASADTALGAFTVVVRDLNNNPVLNKLVELRLLNCPGARVASDSYQTGVTIACATHGVTTLCNNLGVARFCAVGGGTEGAAPGGGPCAGIYAAGVLLGTVPVAYVDLDGVAGVSIHDLTLWLQDLALNEPIGRSDFDGDGTVGINDLSVWLGFFGEGGSSESAAAYCP